jgi:itaconate CoA-transferase
MAPALPLAGLTVVSVEQAVAAPFCTARLADAGARVIKIERPEGDFARGYDALAKGQSSYFVWLNRGKESIVLDLTEPPAAERLRRLIGEADVVVQNLKPGALARLGFAPAALRKRDQRLITCSISGYGDDGPMADRKAYDLLIQAESGLCSLTGGPEDPARVGISVVDIATGATAYAAVLEALVRRGTTGEGADIRVSMFDVIADWLTVPLLQYEGGAPPKRLGLAHPSIAPYGVFRTKDGCEMLLSVQNDREWTRLCREVLGDPGLATDPRFATNPARTRHRAETDGLVARAFSQMTCQDAEARLLSADAAFARVNDMAALSRHPHLRRIAIQTPDGEISLPAPGARFVGEDRRYGAVPDMGETDRTR